ncbi:PP2C family protein-serine/threonine phosphatase [Blastococcus sp. SYSU D00820]
MAHALPLGLLALVVAADVSVGPEQVLLGTTVLAPMAAATVLGRRATAGYTALALVTAALLGFYDRQYTGDAWMAQLIRLGLVLVGGGLAVTACTLRLRREAQLRRLAAQRAGDRAVVALGETLQRSLLTDPPQLPRLEVAVRYVPATRFAQVGGDWYDAFRLPDGSTMLVIGDAAGHDAPATATMSQARGMLRGLGQSIVGSPAAVLTTLDRAFTDLEMHTLVTAVVATVSEQPDGGLVLRWSNAGHPPPVLVTADGRVTLLERRVDRLLGADPCTTRADHVLRLAPGDTLVLYTDGLVERRDAPLDVGTADLVAALQGTAGRPLEALCDDLLTGLGGRADDDVALLAVRAR